MGTIQAYHRRFADLTIGTAHVEKLFDGLRWGEGPVYFADGDYFLCSDIPNNRLLQWVDGLGLRVFRRPSEFSNGNTRDRQGRLITCEHGTRRVSRTEFDGSITVLADRHKGKRFNSPNDVVVASDGSIWFTDPTYGIKSDYEGYKAEREQDGAYVYRLDAVTGKVEAVATDFVQPNGIAFSPDGTKLYVADTGQTESPDGPRHIRRFSVKDGKSLSGGEVFVVCNEGLYDGFRFDTEGNLWTSAGPGVTCYASDGTPLGRIDVGEPVANLTFGGPRRNRLFMTAKSSAYALYVNAKGAGLG